MHSHDPNKDDSAFQKEFERTLREAGEAVADFTKFVFPAARYPGRKFKPACIFLEAAFRQEAYFFEATFAQEADFREATFTQAAVFDSARFAQDARFAAAKFAEDANFINATFTQGADFYHATFSQAAGFSFATFTQTADFSEATFTQTADFRGATFTQTAEFRFATFTRTAEFSEAMFIQYADFRGAAFAQAAHFSDATFEEESDFTEVTFRESAEFRETRFREDASAEPGPIFSLARFEKPELLLFYKTYLGQALFHNCDISKCVFSAVRWRQRPNGKGMVLEEAHDLDLSQEFTSALRTEEGDSDERNYGLIAELYQQLKKNYDDRKDYWTAGDFHYGEMEMKRLATPHPNRLSRWIGGKIAKWLGKVNPGFLARLAKSRGVSERSFHVLRRGLHRHLGLAAWYKRVSEYGESYGLPFLWLVTILALILPWFPVFGLRPSAGVGADLRSTSQYHPATATPELSYTNFVRYGSTQPNGPPLRWWSPLGHSAMTTLGVSAFQRDLAYEPSYPWGRLLAILEILLTSTLLALFLLAVRRQFRR
jgi:uncharacterized protein YjbI with pentapeptide repeats